MCWSVFVQKGLYSTGPSFIERYSCNSLQNVDSVGFDSKLKNGRGLVVEIGRGHPPQRCSVCREGSEDSLTVFLIGLDENI